MATVGIGDVIEQALELASRGKIVEGTALINEPDTDQTGDLEMCRLLFKSFHAMRNGLLETGIREMLLAIKHLERSGYRHLLNWAYSDVGVNFGILGSPDVGLEWVNKAFTGAEDRSNEFQMRRSLSDRGFLLGMLDKYAEAVAAYEQALHMRDVSLSVEEEAGLFNDLSETHLHFARRHVMGNSDMAQSAEKAYEHARTAQDLIEPLRNARLHSRTFTNLGSALSLTGKFAEAEDAFNKALTEVAAFPDLHIRLLSAYAWMLCDVNRYEEANVMLIEAYEKAQSSNREGVIDQVFEARIRLEMLAGKTAEALTWLERQKRFAETRSRQRLAVIARNAEIFVDVERTRLYDRRNKIQTGALSALKALGSQSTPDQADALKDALTGCLNRQGFVAHAQTMFIPGGRAALAIVDADNFRSINDRYGHQVGDKVLKTICKIFADSLRGSDLVARYDGEEFALLLHGIGTEIAWGICERLRLAVEHHGWGNVNPGLHVTVSIGVSAREKDESLDDLTAVAAKAISRAKSEGSNRVVAGA